MVKRRFVLLLLLAACQSHATRAHRVERQEDAASTHVAVISVAPWESYVANLQPVFKFTPEDARKRAIPVTRQIHQRIVDALHARFEANLAEAKVSKTTTQKATSKTGEDTVVETVVESKTKENMEDSTTASKPDTGVRDSVDRMKSSLGPQAGEGRDSSQKNVDVDPMLEYLAATALYQEVQLLNRYVRDAALRKGYAAYVVRLQITMMPMARREPYDAYCNISFFAASESDRAPAVVARTTGGLEAAAGDSALTPQIVPLLVTDNLEATSRTRAIQSLREYALALSFLSSSSGAGAGLSQLTAEFSRMMSREMNSLLTVGRLSDNTLRVRLGAMHQGEEGYTMVPRSHNVSLLVMVPERAPRRVKVVSATSVVDAVTGKTLRNRNAAELEARLAAIAASYPVKNLDAATLQALMVHAQANDQAEYFDEFRARTGGADTTFGEAIWVDLISVLAGSQYSSSMIDLPDPASAPDAVAYPSQTVMLQDDGSRSFAVLRGGAEIQEDDLFAFVLLPTPKETHRIVAKEIEIVGGGRRATFTFPALAHWKLSGVPPDGVKLVVRYADGESVEYPILFPKEPN